MGYYSTPFRVVFCTYKNLQDSSGLLAVSHFRIIELVIAAQFLIFNS
jgi:hypothetical protein